MFGGSDDDSYGDNDNFCDTDDVSHAHGDVSLAHGEAFYGHDEPSSGNAAFSDALGGDDGHRICGYPYQN